MERVSKCSQDLLDSELGWGEGGTEEEVLRFMETGFSDSEVDKEQSLEFRELSTVD